MRVGHYRLEKVIGVGSFATVHKARDERLDDDVVVKILAENHSLNPEIRERFIAEGRSLRRVEGAHVVAIYDIGETERHQPYLVLEYADRGTMESRVHQLWNSGWQPGTDDILAFARPLAAAVDSVHRAQLVHRDLSPGNILLASKPSELIGDESAGLNSRIIGEGERLVIADLGMCKDLAMNSGLTVSTGTAGFRPPEQNRPGLVDTRADIWAISAVLAWLTQSVNLAAEFDAVLTRGMQRDPNHRQPDAASWLAEIEKALTPEPPPPQPEPAPGPVTESESQVTVPMAETQTASEHRGSGWGKLVISSMVFCAAALGLLAGLLFNLGRDPEPEGPPAEAEGVSISISGPDEVQVGEAAVFTAEVEGVDSWVWSLPTSTHIANEEEAVMTATEPGEGEVVLRARVPNGPELEARHMVSVSE